METSERGKPYLEKEQPRLRCATPGKLSCLLGEFTRRSVAEPGKVSSFELASNGDAREMIVACRYGRNKIRLIATMKQ